jgi:hypothetical protein
VVTIGHIYINSASHAFYKYLFDEVQKAVLSLTGRPMCFKRLSPGGNLLALNVDLEEAQVLAAGHSFLPTNDLEYSRINTEDPAVLVEYFVKACHTHVKRYEHYVMLQF